VGPAIPLGPVGLSAIGQHAQPPVEVVEAALDVMELGQELERLLPADGVPGAGASIAVATELLDVEAPVHAKGAALSLVSRGANPDPRHDEPPRRPRHARYFARLERGVGRG